MDVPSGTQASVPRKPRRKRSNKNGKQASYRAGLNLQPRNAQFKRSSQQPPQQGSQQLGFFGSVPSLQDLRRENRRNTRRHYRAHGRQVNNAMWWPCYVLHSFAHSFASGTLPGNARGQAVLPSGGNAVPLPAPLSVPPAPFNSTRQALACRFGGWHSPCRGSALVSLPAVCTCVCREERGHHPTPPSPPSPLPPTATLNPLATPALEPCSGGGHGTMFDASGVNFYGSNEGLVLPLDVFPTSSGSSSEDSEVGGARNDCASTHSPGQSGQHSMRTSSMKPGAHPPEREVYIDRLEDENLRWVQAMFCCCWFSIWGTAYIQLKSRSVSWGGGKFTVERRLHMLAGLGEHCPFQCA